MEKKYSRIGVVLLALAMTFMLSSCSATDNEYMDFLLNGWDGVVDGKEIAPQPGEVTEDGEVVSEDGEVTVTTPDGKVVTVAGGTTGGKTTGGTSTQGGTTGGKTSGTASGSGSGIAASGSQKGSSSSNSGSGSAPVAKSYTAAEALDIYKKAANAVKTTSGAKAVLDKEVTTEISGSIPGFYSTFGFKPGTKTNVKTCDSSSKLKDDFCVEGQSYVCNLSADDIKSANCTVSGNNYVVTISVKDDSENTYDRSSKCVSTISVPIGKWTCKGVTLKGVINANGQLTSLYYNMPTYVTSGGDEFAFSLEQYWTITY